MPQQINMKKPSSIKFSKISHPLYRSVAND